MSKKLIAILGLIILASCQSYDKEELKKTSKASSASQRINSSDSNSSNLLKELD